MLLVGLLTPFRAAHWRKALGPASDIRIAATARELSNLWGAEPDVIVVDPAIDPTSLVELAVYIAEHPAAGVVLDVDCCPGSFRRAVMIASQVRVQLLIRGVDDRPDEMRRLVDALTPLRMGRQVLSRIAHRMFRLPPPIATILREMYLTLRDVGNVWHLGRCSHTPTRTLSRQFRRVGLAPPRIVLRSARCIRAYHYLTNTDKGIDAVAQHAGFTSGRVLTADLQLLTGCSARELRLERDPDKFVDRLSRRLLS